MPLSSYREFDAALAFAAESVERTMERLLPRAFRREQGETRVFEAMRYSSLGGGKRLRAFFVLASATLFKVGAIPAIRTASAIEFVHAYSLIHDDLPAMDDDDLRRGQPTCHKQFDEATAILAGDALLTLAFEVLADTGHAWRSGGARRSWSSSSPRRPARTAWSAARCSTCWPRSRLARCRSARSPACSG